MTKHYSEYRKKRKDRAIGQRAEVLDNTSSIVLVSTQIEHNSKIICHYYAPSDDAMEVSSSSICASGFCVRLLTLSLALLAWPGALLDVGAGVTNIR